jgi:hypothetical protein
LEPLALFKSVLLIRIMLMRMQIRILLHFDEGLDPDPTFLFDADPDSSFQIKAQNLEKVLR